MPMAGPPVFFGRSPHTFLFLSVVSCSDGGKNPSLFMRAALLQQSEAIEQKHVEQHLPTAMELVTTTDRLLAEVTRGYDLINDWYVAFSFFSGFPRNDSLEFAGRNNVHSLRHPIYDFKTATCRIGMHSGTRLAALRLDGLKFIFPRDQLVLPPVGPATSLPWFPEKYCICTNYCNLAKTLFLFRPSSNMSSVFAYLPTPTHRASSRR